MEDRLTHNDAAPALSCFGPFASTIARITSVQPDLIPTLWFASSRDVHSIAAFLSLTEDVDEISSEDLGSELVAKSPGDLLRTVIPHAPPGLYDALETAGPHARDSVFYSCLASICHHPDASRLITSGKMDPAFLEGLQILLEAGPRLNFATKLPNATEHAATIAALDGFLTAYGISLQAWLWGTESIEVGDVLAAVRKAIRGLRAPQPDLISNTFFETIPTVRELIDAVDSLEPGGCPTAFCGSDQFANWTHLVSGRSMFIRNRFTGLVARLDIVAPNTVVVERRSRKPSSMFAAVIESTLDSSIREAGFTQVKYDAREALMELHRVCR